MRLLDHPARRRGGLPPRLAKCPPHTLQLRYREDGGADRERHVILQSIHGHDASAPSHLRGNCDHSGQPLRIAFDRITELYDRDFGTAGYTARTQRDLVDWATALVSQGSRRHG